MQMKLMVNGVDHMVECDPQMPILWVIRDLLQLTGTKYGCGKGLCGACTIHLDGQAIRSCQIPISSVMNQKITTIEGLDIKQEDLHPVQQAWIDADVPQCGFCQAGQIMQAASLLAGNSKPSKQLINSAMAGNLCRCGTYTRIRSAINLVVKEMEGKTDEKA